MAHMQSNKSARALWIVIMAKAERSAMVSSTSLRPARSRTAIRTISRRRNLRKAAFSGVSKWSGEAFASVGVGPSGARNDANRWVM